MEIVPATVEDAAEILSLQNIRFYESLGYTPFREQVVNESLILIYLEKNAAASGK